MRDSVVTLRALVDEGVEKEIDIVGRLRVTFPGGLNQRRRVPHLSLVGDGVRGLPVFLSEKTQEIGQPPVLDKSLSQGSLSNWK